MTTATNTQTNRTTKTNTLNLGLATTIKEGAYSRLDAWPTVWLGEYNKYVLSGLLGYRLKNDVTRLSTSVSELVLELDKYATKDYVDELRDQVETNTQDITYLKDSLKEGSFYKKLDDWNEYDESEDAVLSAKLGYGLKSDVDLLKQSAGLVGVYYTAEQVDALLFLKQDIVDDIETIRQNAYNSIQVGDLDATFLQIDKRMDAIEEFVDSSVGYNRLDDWDEYVESNGDVLSAKLGYGLKERLDDINIPTGDYVKIGDKISTLTNDLEYQTKTLVSTAISDAISEWNDTNIVGTYLPANEFNKSNIKEALKISDWALAEKITTDDVEEGNNLYFTEEKAKSALKDITDDFSRRITELEDQQDTENGLDELDNRLLIIETTVEQHQTEIENTATDITSLDNRLNEVEDALSAVDGVKDWFVLDGDVLKTPYNLASENAVSSLGVGTTDGGSIVSYNRLDVWPSVWDESVYGEYVLGALLGKELKDAIENIEIPEIEEINKSIEDHEGRITNNRKDIDSLVNDETGRIAIIEKALSKIKKWFTLDEADGTLKTVYNLASDKAVSSLGVSSPNGTGSGISYTRLDDWANYDTSDEATTDGWVLSAKLGYDLYSEVKTISDENLKGISDRVTEVEGDINTINDILSEHSTLIKGNSEDVADLEERMTPIEKAFAEIKTWFTLEGDVLKTAYNLASDKAVSSLGVSSGGAGGGASYDRLDRWESWNEGSGAVLSADLGYGLLMRIEDLESGTNGNFSELDSKIAALEGEHDALAERVDDFLTEADVDETINRWKELEAFLAGYTETATLADLLGVKADKSVVDALTATVNSNYTTLDGLITAEKNRAVAAEGALSTRITTNATNIGKNATAIAEIQDTLADWFTLEDGVLHSKYGLASDSAVSSLGKSSSSGGSGVSYDRLDDWTKYDASAGAVLSATLGYDLKTRLDNLDLGDFDLSGYLTVADAQKTYATITDLNSGLAGKQDSISDLATIRTNASLGKEAHGWGNHASAGYATQTALNNLGDALDNYKTIVADTYFTKDSFTKANIKSTLGISDWALASVKPSYKTSEVTESGNLYFTNERAVAALKSITDALSARIKVYEDVLEVVNDTTGKYLHALIAFASDSAVSSLGAGSSSGGGGSVDWGAVPTNIIPATNNAYTLGAEDYYWRKLFANGLQFDTDVVGLIEGGDIRFTTDLVTFVNDVVFNNKPTVNGSAVATMADLSDYVTKDSLGAAAYRGVQAVAATETSPLVTKDWTENKLSGYATTAVATTSTNGLMSTAMVSKLNGIATGATAVTSNTVSGWGYTKNTGTVTSVAIKMNDSTKGTVTSSGTIDLGTVLTAHQSLSDYYTKTQVHSYVAQEINTFNENLPVIPTKTSQLTNDSEFVLASSLGTAASKSWSGVATTDSTNLVTSAWVESKIANLNIPDTSSFAKTTDLGNYFPLAGGKTITGKVTISSAGSLEVQGNAYIGGTLYKGLNTNDPYATQSWVTSQGYTKNVGTVTSIKINGATKNPTNGVVDLGTITADTSELESQIEELDKNKQSLITAANKLAYSLISGTPTSLPASDVYAWAKEATKPSYAWSEITSKPTFATVATSGSYNDLSNKPTIPSAVTVENNLTSTSTTSALSAAQGKALNDSLNSLNGSFTGLNYYLTTNGTAGQVLTKKSSGYEWKDSSVAWSNISSKPTTLSGYGITDAYTASTIDTKLADYQPLSTAINTGNIGSQSVAKSTFLARQVRTADTIDSFLSTDGVQMCTIANYSAPGWAGSDGMILSIPWGSLSWGAQIAIDDSGNHMAMRSKTGSAWRAWRVFAFTDSNVASATKLNDNADYTAWGQTFFSAGKPKSVSGAISGCSRIGNASQSSLYLGNSDNSGWVATQDICSDGGTSLWAIRNQGQAFFKVINAGYTYPNGGAHAANINGDIFTSGALRLGTDGVSLAYASSALQVTTPYGSSYFGMMNTSYCHLYTDAPAFYFNKSDIYVVGGNRVYHTGNLSPLTTTNYSNYALPISGGTMTGKLIATAGGSGSTSISYANAALLIGTVNRTNNGNDYYPGIAFSHMYTYGSGTAFRNHAHAWIGLRLYDTPAAERSYLIFATNGDSTTGTSPVERMCISPFGNVGIGTTSPSYKLHVEGTMYASGNVTIGGGLTVGGYTVATQNWVNTAITEALNTFNEENLGTAASYGVTTSVTSGSSSLVTSGGVASALGGYVGKGGGAITGTLSIGSTRLNVGSTTLHGDVSLEYGALTITHGTIGSSHWSITNDGAATVRTLSQTSDERLKSIHSYSERFGVKDIAGAPVAYFAWKDGSDTDEHLGTIAQYWKQIVPQCVYGKEGSMSMDYSTLGLVSSIINAREIVKHESEIDTLKRRVKELEDRLAAYEAA